MQAGQIGEVLIGVGGQFSSFIPTGASTTILKRGPGRVCRIVITAPGTAGFTVFDNTAGSGSVIYASPATTSAGQVIDLLFPTQTGITVTNVASGPAFGISFN